MALVLRYSMEVSTEKSNNCKKANEWKMEKIQESHIKHWFQYEPLPLQFYNGYTDDTWLGIRTKNMI